MGTQRFPNSILAYRDLVRGEALALPSGEAISRVMGIESLSQNEVGLRTTGWTSETPPWYYILKEAQVLHRGERLGEVGDRIVDEVLLGLIDGDSNSYHNAETERRPELPSAQAGHFTMADLLHDAGEARIECAWLRKCQVNQ